jgi:hypothetical protein
MITSGIASRRGSSDGAGGRAPSPGCDAPRDACRDKCEQPVTLNSERRDAHEHWGLGARRVARGELCRAKSARAAAALHEAPTAGGGAV